MKVYFSLTRGLLGLYYPIIIPDEFQIDGWEDLVARHMMETSKLKGLWCTTYTEKQADDAIARHGGIKLPDSMSSNLDYDHHLVSVEVQKFREKMSSVL